jgi:hypothetical protein
MIATRQRESKLLRTAKNTGQLINQLAHSPKIETAIQEFKKIKDAYQLSLRKKSVGSIHVHQITLKDEPYPLLISSGLIEAYGSVASVQFYVLYPKEEAMELPDSELRKRLIQKLGQ